jgi:hypothetical protein
MPHGKNDGGLSVVAVQRDVAAVAKVNQPLPVFWFHVLCGRPVSSLTAMGRTAVVLMNTPVQAGYE